MKKIILIIFFFITKVEASVIYDYEIESFISNILQKINSDEEVNINFSLILNDIPNAFVGEENKIYLTSGLLKYIQSPEALIGVLAHEVGHIKKFHITKRKKRIKNIQILDQVSSLAAVTTSLLSNNPEILLQSVITSKSNIQNYYSAYSKNQEKEADLYAIQKLNELKISSKGLIKFLEFLEYEFNKKGYSKDSFMFSTHPNYNDRINIINNLSNDKYTDIDNRTLDKFLFIKAKLFGHTEKNIQSLDKYLSGNYLDYAISIILAKQGKLFESMIKINNLIEKKPDNIFLLETKADILFNHGYSLEAKKFYQKALYKNNKNLHIMTRLFNISYDSIENENYENVNNIYHKYNDIIFNYYQNINFYYKWLHIFKILKKDDWILFIESWINILKDNKKEAIIKLKEIKKTSNNNKLIYNANKLINQIDNA